MTVGSEKEAVECFGDLQGGSISDTHSCSHLYQDAIEFIARAQALDVPLYNKTIDGTTASTILPLLRLLTKISPSHHSCKADSHTKSNGSTTPRDTNRNQPIRTDLTKPDIPSYTNSRQYSAQDLGHGVTQ